MTLHRVIHEDGNTISTRESDKNLDFVVVVKTPVETRHAIQDLVEQVELLSLDNIDRALTDGTVTEWAGQTYIGGLAAPSVAWLQEEFDAALELVKSQQVFRESLVDLYQVVGWFDSYAGAVEMAERTRADYNNEFVRQVYVDFTTDEV